MSFQRFITKQSTPNVKTMVWLPFENTNRKKLSKLYVEAPRRFWHGPLTLQLIKEPSVKCSLDIVGQRSLYVIKQSLIWHNSLLFLSSTVLRHLKMKYFSKLFAKSLFWHLIMPCVLTYCNYHCYLLCHW